MRRSAKVPGPDLVGAGGEQLRLVVVRMTEEVAAFTNLLGLVKDAIHGSRRAVINAVIKQSGLGLGWGLVHEAFRIEHIANTLPFGLGEGSRRGPAGRRCIADTRRLLPAVEAGPGYTQGLASGRDPHGRGEFRGSGHESLPSLSRVFRGIPKISEAFF
jgi:hypothetical protein